MNKEFKIALGLLVLLFSIATVLLEVLAKIHFWSASYFQGFIPFSVLLIPYILYSSEVFCERSRVFAGRSFLNKLLIPAGILAAYVIASVWPGNFSPSLFLRLALWVLVPLILLVSPVLENHKFYVKEFLAALILWLPIEFGKLSGFDIKFSEGIQIPALAFGAPVLGLYLFLIVRNLPDIGYHFRWKWPDFVPVVFSLLALSVTLIPIGIRLNFLRYGGFDTPVAEMVESIFGIYFLVALPEELLFRSIIQNLCAKIFSRLPYSKWIALAAASVIFGMAHYNNLNPPSWPYVILAAIAGAFYGWTFMVTGKITIAAVVHMGVDFIWGILFKGVGG